MNKTMGGMRRPAAARWLRWGLVALASVAPGAACAADMAAAPAVAPPVPVASDWRVQLTVYGWATALNGDVGVGNMPSASVDVPFSEVLRHLDGALMGSVFIENDRWIVLADLVYAKLSDSQGLPSYGAGVDVGLTETIATGAVGYKLPTGRSDLDVAFTAGARYVNLKATVGLNVYGTAANLSASARQSWIDPTVGVFAHWTVSDKWFVNAIADIGGFGVGSTVSSTGYLGVGYLWTDSFSTALGYRYLYENYEGPGLRAGTFRYDTTMHGPTVAFAWRF